jgi:hypothetical protein
MNMSSEELEKELKEVKELMVDLERPTTRNLMGLDAIDIVRKGLTNRFKSLLVAKAKKVDKDSIINISPCSTQARPQLITTFYRENPSSSPAQEEQESPS